MVATKFLVFINNSPEGVLSKIVSQFEKMESATELRVDLNGIVKWGNMLLVTFNAAKRPTEVTDPSLAHLEMNDTELPEYPLLDLNFTSTIYRKPYIRSIRLPPGKCVLHIDLRDSLLIIPYSYSSIDCKLTPTNTTHITAGLQKRKASK